MKTQPYASLVVAALVLALVVWEAAACGGQEPAPPTPQPEQAAPGALDGATLMQDRCGRCHGVDRVTRAAKTQQEWKATVARMVGKGATLSAVEQEVLVQYLAANHGK